ncbi:hypothetical protein MSAN_01126600 [Mycena sanguinolenta]|uniref:Uncharacterized protein n=1 Tax=Mycena sanguinolenta TaxID=230812 RepID=A0A8H6YN80_9AGAR|nr:hypothetical protein MSAN_01126600 [Mycena sanguinolenta]
MASVNFLPATRMANMRLELFHLFRRIYGPAALLAAVLVAIAFTSLGYKAEQDRSVYILMLSLSTAQGYMLLLGSYYFKDLYFRMRAAFSILALFHTMFWFILRNVISEMLMVQIYILYADVLSCESGLERGSSSILASGPWISSCLR